LKASKDDSDRFSNAMNKKKKKKSPHEGVDGRHGRTMGDAILQGMLGDAKAEALAPKTDAERIDSMVDRILVSADKADKEVRIQLKDSILPGTEIRMTRDDAGLKLQLVTTHQSSMNFLTEHRDNLQQTLAQKLSTDVQVDLNYQEGGDGRSRERRDMYEEMKANEDKKV
ncbi:MAG: hypothetical protein MI717_09945, partial [Spirochaetales bacterium]|nr:hypothetical protein [Spirochaetales bacterium]